MSFRLLPQNLAGLVRGLKRQRKKQDVVATTREIATLTSAILLFFSGIAPQGRLPKDCLNGILGYMAQGDRLDKDTLQWTKTKILLYRRNASYTKP